MTAPLRIRINRLVLHGFDPRDRHAIGDAVRAELARMFAGGEGTQGEKTLPHSRDVARIGADIARATHGAVTKETDRGR